MKRGGQHPTRAHWNCSSPDWQSDWGSNPSCKTRDCPQRTELGHGCQSFIDHAVFRRHQPSRESLKAAIRNRDGSQSDSDCLQHLPSGAKMSKTHQQWSKVASSIGFRPTPASGSSLLAVVKTWSPQTPTSGSLPSNQAYLALSSSGLSDLSLSAFSTEAAPNSYIHPESADQTRTTSVGGRSLDFFDSAAPLEGSGSASVHASVSRSRRRHASPSRRQVPGVNRTSGLSSLLSYVRPASVSLPVCAFFDGQTESSHSYTTLPPSARFAAGTHSQSKALPNQLLQVSYSSASASLQAPYSPAGPASSLHDSGLDGGARRTGRGVDYSSGPSYLSGVFSGAGLLPSKRSYIFSHGAYGIPKHGHQQAGTGGSGRGPRISHPLYPNTSQGAAGELKSQRDRAYTSPTKTAREDVGLSVQVGEDAYFLRTDSLGVADGVGGWSGHKGADPALFSRKLMHHCSSEMARYDDIEDEMFLQYYDVDPVQVLHRASESCLSEAREEGIIGSSTALLAILRNDELRLANVGDCCCSIIRGQDYIFRSEEQQHSFNFPVQIGTNSKDTPLKDAQSFTVKVQKNDIVILSSDGLVDNLFDEDILEEVLRFAHYAPAAPTPTEVPRHGNEAKSAQLNLLRFSPQAVSEALCSRAKAVSEDQRAVSSPFQQRAMEEGIHYVGGKNDDISVLVAVVGDSEDSAVC
ncbi:uncharacterized protein L969DRAFT_44596 [Mixia osmundae IAM 14324]|uniref:uncharacterized protein n=1 Tax=Mixia osmundae (strain CBS 9802 / IAM 14324 / JCM 22182 / KY 12970) TaxID=764103 RepID=UPI0004A54D40|nr:uncharacterized protein L969DRAFT_44596 [Mixia osmundae IAM 14324]KEI41735.1 hypothetical protein L969DRAFT_44596 [Mixia osmundae IAM 14324]